MEPACTSRNRVFGPAPKCHLSRFGWPLGTNDRSWSRFMSFGVRSRFISGNRSRFIVWTRANASTAWHVALCGAVVLVHAMNRDQRPAPAYKLVPSPWPFATKICWICVCGVGASFFSFDCTQGVRRNVHATFKFAQHGILRWLATLSSSFVTDIKILHMCPCGWSFHYSWCYCNS
jgi:hypothetical protein